MALLVVLLVSAPANAETLPFEIQNARGPNGLVLTVPSGVATRWSRVVRVVLASDASGRHPTDHLKITGMVESDGGDQVIVTASPIDAVDLAAEAFVEVTLNATLPRAGIYKGELLLVRDDGQRVVPLQITVTRTAAIALPIASLGGTAVAVTGGSRAQVPFVVHNTGAEPLKVEATVVTVTRVDKVSSPTVRIAIPEATPPTTKPIDIAAGKVGTFDIGVDRLDTAGIYAVEAMFRHVPDEAGTYQSRALAMTVYKRDAWWLAAVSIALGAALAWSIRQFISDGNGRLTARQSFAALGEEVRTFRTGATYEPILLAARALELETIDLDRDLRWGGSVGAANGLLKRAQLRFLLLKEIAEAHRTLAMIPFASQAAARQTLDDMLVRVRVDPGTEADLESARKSIRDLKPRAVWRELIATKLAELRQAIASQQQASGATVHLKALLEALRIIETKLGEVDTFLAQDELSKAAKLIDQQRDEFVNAGIEELRRIAASPRPSGIGEDAWTQVTKDLLDHANLASSNTSFAARFAALQAGQRLYFQVIEHAKPMRDEIISKGPGSTEGFLDFRSTQRGWLPLALSTTSAASEQPVFDNPASAQQLRATLTSYRWLTNVAVFVIAVATGIQVLYLDNPAWGGWPAYLLAFLWGAGIQVTGDAFSGIIALRAKLGGAAA